MYRVHAEPRADGGGTGGGRGGEVHLEIRSHSKTLDPPLCGTLGISVKTRLVYVVVDHQEETIKNKTSSSQAYRAQ